MKNNKNRLGNYAQKVFKRKEKSKVLYKKRKIKPQKNIKYSYYKSYKDVKETIEKRYNILIGFIILIMCILFVNLFYIQVIKKDYYKNEVEESTQNIVEGSTAPRGRIYDRNHKVIVDNEPSKIIYYKKPSGITTKEEIDLAYQVGEIISVDFSSISETKLKEFWMAKYPKKADKKITDKEWQKLEERKLTSDDIEDMKLERITAEDLSIFTDVDKEAAMIYTLMNKGYASSEKIIKKENITDEEYALISERSHLLNGFNTRLDWERSYPYGSVFRAMLGSVSSSDSGIPYELKDYYLAKGYSLNDRVGTSYLEYQYESTLRGTKNKYQIMSDGEYRLTQEGKRGNDIVLTIDIELQKAVEEILTEEVLKAKEEPNTELYNRSFVIIADPKTGEILAMAGKQVIKEGDSYQILDYTPGITTSPVVVGSVIKGASHIVGYNTGALTIGEKRLDTCVKIAATPQKCSWKYLGMLDDITALKQSSNTYQFYTAIKVGNGNYVYNQPLSLDPAAFDTYRNTFAEFGLGVETGIDLPVESLGYKGNSTVSGHLLDFSIGQYDTYTPIQLSQYIGTIANNGSRLQSHLLKEIYASDTDESLVKRVDYYETTVLNVVNTKAEYLERVKLGFKAVMEYGGTGSGYIDLKYKPAGKTGTSQSFVDTDGDGNIDTETVTNTFAGYAPYDDPKVTFTVISPDIYNYANNSTYQTTVNKRITQRVSQKYFELYGYE